MSNALDRARAAYRVIAQTPNMTVDEITERLPGLRPSQVCDALAKLFRAGVIASDGPIGETRVRRYHVTDLDHPDYKAGNQ